MTIIIGNDEIQKALVAKLKSLATVTALVPSVEIREDYWQGTSFSYPNIRVRMIDAPLNKPCPMEFSAGFMVFTEDASSQNADKIAGIIGKAINDTSFVAEGVSVALRVTNLLPAVRSDIRTWRSECLVSGIVSKP